MGHRQYLGVFAIVVSGCATCKPEHILQLKAQNSMSFKASSYDKNAEDLFLYNEGVSVWLRPCSRNYGPNRGSICASIFVPAERTATLQKAEVRIVPEKGSAPKINRISEVSFAASCSSPSSDPSSCRPDTRGFREPASLELTQSYNYQGQWWFHYKVGLNPLAKLPGGHTPDTSFRRLLAYDPYKINALSYWLSIEESNLASAGTLFLPSINVGGTLIDLPAVIFAPTVAEVCTRRAI
jgi:hypothetical protein